MSEHPKLHLVLSVIAIFLAIILLIWTMAEPAHDNVKVMIEVMAHMVTFYLSMDIIVHYHKNMKAKEANVKKE